ADRRALLAATEGAPAMADDRPLVALSFARDKDDTVRFAVENAAFLRSLRGDAAVAGAALDIGGLAAADRARFTDALERSSAAKALLLEVRARPNEAAALAARALAIAPDDLEARAL